MKTAFSLLALIASISFGYAGNFGGPPPFTNGSPLPSGNDGTYQAIAQGTNLSGLISFTIQDGQQVQGTGINNSWVFFVDGETLSGSVAAVISADNVSGVLDSGGQALTGLDGELSGTTVFLVPGNAAAGNFNGKINQQSPIGGISGKGILDGTPARVDQLIYILDISDLDPALIPPASDLVGVVPVNIPASTFPATSFNFRGSRVSLTIGTSSGSTTSSTTTTTN